MTPAGRVIVALALVGASLGLTACGDSARDRVEAYIERSNELLRESSGDLQAANQAYERFRAGKLPPGQAAARLGAAEQAIRATRADLAQVSAPPEARELRRRLLTFFDANALLAGEATALARYLPAARKAIAPLERTSRRLRTGLNEEVDAERQARALRRYRGGLDSILEDLRGLDPPPVLLPTHEAQVERLRDTRNAAAKLRRAIDDQDAEKIARLVLRFEDIGQRPADDALAAAAVRSYGVRVDAVQRTLRELEDERRRLTDTLE